MEFDYTVKTKKTFNRAISAVEEETAKAGFKVYISMMSKKQSVPKVLKSDRLKSSRFAMPKVLIPYCRLILELAFVSPAKSMFMSKTAKHSFQA